MSTQDNRCCAPEGWHVASFDKTVNGVHYVIHVSHGFITAHASGSPNVFPAAFETLESALAAVDAHVAERARGQEGAT